MGLDRVGSPPGRTLLAAVTGRWRRGPAGPYCRAVRRRSSSRWRAIAGSRYECIDVGPSSGDLWVPSARSLGAPWGMRLPGCTSAGAITGAGEHLGPYHIEVSRVGGQGLLPGALAPGPWPVDTDRLHCVSSPRPTVPSHGGRWRTAWPWWPGPAGNGTKSGRRGASPESACRVECRDAPIGHPEVLYHQVVDDALVGPVRGEQRSTSRRLRPLVRGPGRHADGGLPARR